MATVKNMIKDALGLSNQAKLEAARTKLSELQEELNGIEVKLRALDVAPANATTQEAYDAAVAAFDAAEKEHDRRLGFLRVEVPRQRALVADLERAVLLEQLAAARAARRAAQRDLTLRGVATGNAVVALLAEYASAVLAAERYGNERSAEVGLARMLGEPEPDGPVPAAAMNVAFAHAQKVLFEANAPHHRPPYEWLTHPTSIEALVRVVREGLALPPYEGTDYSVAEQLGDLIDDPERYMVRWRAAGAAQAAALAQRTAEIVRREKVQALKDAESMQLGLTAAERQLLEAEATKNPKAAGWLAAGGEAD